MFYDIFLDEVFYLIEESSKCVSNNRDLFLGLDTYSKREINNFKNGKITIVRNQRDIDKFISTNRNILSNNEKLYYGKLKEETANKILKVLPYDLKGFNLSLQRHNLKHIEKKHGNPISEIIKGQYNIIKSDFYLIPEIIGEADYIKATHDNEFNNKSLEIIKEIDKCIYHLVVYISLKNHNIEIKTLYKKKKELLS